METPPLSPGPGPSSSQTYLLWGEGQDAPPRPRARHRGLPRVCRPWRLWHRTALCLAGPRKASWRRCLLVLAALLLLLLLYSLGESSHRSIMR